jgi:hypothetical protein
MTKILILSSLLVLGCTIKPPVDDDELGVEVTATQINKAFADAQAGFQQSKAYRVGDKGTLQVVDQVINNMSIRETHDLEVVEINSQAIIYVERIKESGEAYEISIARENPSPTPTPSPTPVAFDFFEIFPRTLSDTLKLAYGRVQSFFSSITVEPSLAIGQEAPSAPQGIVIKNLPRVHNFLQARLNKYLDLAPEVHAQDVSPTPTPAPKKVSRYFDLRTSKHKFLTKNCAQLADCKVNATHVQYKELMKNQSGEYIQIHWVYEISIEVPGLFTVMEECYSTLVDNAGGKIPLTECYHVDDFKFGFVN